MKIKLYKPFEHWYHGGTIFLYSDPHFDDPESESINPKWPSSEEIVNKINNGLGKCDTIIFLGDIGNEEWIKKIRGYKVLLLGNHDKGVSNYIKKYIVHGANRPDSIVDTLEQAEDEKEYRILDTSNADVKILDNGLFDEVYEGPLFINEKICLSHEPVELHFGINIHGHNHCGKKFSSYWTGNHYCRKINICSDVVDFEKQRLDELIDGIKTPSIHRETIDNAIYSKKFREEFLKNGGFVNEWVDYV